MMMTSYSLWSTGLALLAALGLASPPLNAEDAPAGDEQRAQQVAEMAKQFVGRCEFTIHDESERRLVLHPQPILRWSNPTAGQVYGDVYLWTDRGRPAAVSGFYKFFLPDWGRSLEVGSLGEHHLTGRVDGLRLWTPNEAGLKFQTLSTAETPAATPAARLVQMRRLAADFKTQLDDTRNNDRGVLRQLRLLPKPVYRYPAANGDAPYLDGALFAFVEGTDPEVWLLLEAISTDKTPSWRFGLARSNRDGLRVSYRDQPVWSVPHLPDPLDHSQQPYTLFSLEHPLKESRRLPSSVE